MVTLTYYTVQHFWSLPTWTHALRKLFSRAIKFDHWHDQFSSTNWGTTDAEIKVTSAENPELSKVPSLKPEEGVNMQFGASLTDEFCLPENDHLVWLVDVALPSVAGTGGCPASVGSEQASAVPCLLPVPICSPWYNRNGWLGVKHQVTYFPSDVRNVWLIGIRKSQCTSSELLSSTQKVK